MSALRYTSGDEIKKGDRIRYHGDSGHREFVATQRSGEEARHWFVERFPGGGLTISAEGFGSVFIGVAEIDNQLELLSRSAER